MRPSIVGRRLLAPVLFLAAPILGGSGFGLKAQELPWLEGGRVRLDFAPSFWTWASRYGVGPSGEDLVEELGLDLTSGALGSQALPDLVDLEASLAEALGDASYAVNLGVSQAFIDQSRLVFPFRLDIGITDWLTVGAMAPWSGPGQSCCSSWMPTRQRPPMALAPLPLIR